MSVINTNVTSLIAQQNLNSSKGDLTTAMERLSSGLRINSAADDAAGQAIANRMSAQVTGLSQAQRNANDGISVAQTTEGALNQINDNLQRVRELTVQAQNGTNSQDDLQSIQNEIGQRLGEIDRISEETSFNGVKVLASDQELTIQVGANDGETITIDLDQVNAETLGLATFDVTNIIDVDSLSDSQTTVPGAPETVTIAADSNATPAAEDGLYALADGSGYVVKADDDNYYAADVTDPGAVAWDSSTTAVAASDVDVAGGELTEVPGADVTVTGLAADESLLEIQDDEGQGTGEYVVETVDATTGETTYNAATVDNTTGAVTMGEALEDKPLAALDDALSQVDTLRSDLGAIQNRFDSAITNLSTTETNLTSARSRIQDADYATEVSNMTRNQILQQAGTSILAQANQLPQSVLSLLG